jgi:hypothetical protein
MSKEHMSPITRMERTVELIEQLKVHPYQEEVVQLASEQLEDMYQDIGKPSLVYEV